MDAIRELLARHDEAYRLRDPRTLAGHYTKDAEVSSPMFPHANGRDAVENSSDARDQARRIDRGARR